MFLRYLDMFVETDSTHIVNLKLGNLLWAFWAFMGWSVKERPGSWWKKRAPSIAHTPGGNRTRVAAWRCVYVVGTPSWWATKLPSCMLSLGFIFAFDAKVSCVVQFIKHSNVEQPSLLKGNSVPSLWLVASVLIARCHSSPSSSWRCAVVCWVGV